MENEGDQNGTRTRAGLGHALIVGAIVGTVLSVVGCTLAMVVGGLEELRSAFGFALFVGIWGGLGFGTMFGGVLWASKAIEEERHALDATPRTS